MSCSLLRCSARLQDLRKFQQQRLISGNGTSSSSGNQGATASLACLPSSTTLHMLPQVAAAASGFMHPALAPMAAAGMMLPPGYMMPPALAALPGGWPAAAMAAASHMQQYMPAGGMPSAAASATVFPPWPVVPPQPTAAARYMVQVRGCPPAACAQLLATYQYACRLLPHELPLVPPAMAAGAGQLPPNSILTVVGASFLPLAALAACVQDLTTGQKVFLDPSFNLSTYQPGAPPPGLAGCSTAATAGTAFYNAAAPTAASPANPQTQSQVWAARWLSARPRGTQFTTQRCCVAACTSTAFVCAPVRLLQVTMSENSDGQKSSEQATACTGNGGAGGNGSSGNGYSMAVAGSGDGLPAPGQATPAKEGSGGAVDGNGSSGQSGQVRAYLPVGAAEPE